MRDYRQAAILNGYEITLQDGRTFTAHGKNAEDAVAELRDYLFCEYNETAVAIAAVEQTR